MNPISSTDHGRGPVVVLVHGFCENNEIWQAFERDLSYHFRVISPDLPGFGKSPLPEEPFGLEEIAKQLHDFLLSKVIDQCVMIGHSLGGYITMTFAELFPHMLNGIGMFHSTAYADTEEKKRTRDRTIEFVNKYGMETFIDAFVPELFYYERKEELAAEIEKAVAICKHTTTESLIAYTQAMRDRKDRIHVLETFKKPVLFIAGDEDTAMPLDVVKPQFFIPEDHEIHILAKTGHMGFLEREEESIEVIETFLKEKIYG